MNSHLKFVLALIFLSPCVTAQQNYSGAAVYRCIGNKTTVPSESLYSCNGQHSSCRAFLIFTANSPYVTVVAIANLTSSDKTETSRINNVTTSKVLPEGQEVIIPVECSCSGRNYQATTTYQIRLGETYFIIADKTFKGLSSCDALKHANTYRETSLLPGQKLRVPLRCACPTAEQAAVGTKFLLTYTVGHGDTLLGLSKRFNVSVVSIYIANRFPDEFAEIQPFTTILIPLPSEPSHLQAISRKYNVTTSPPLSPPVALKSRSSRVRLIVGIIAGGFFLLILFLLVLLFLSHKKRARVAESRGRNGKVPSSPQDLILEIASLDRALVYEYMANGTLREWLSRRGSQDTKSWNQRIRIALDVANGLLYLHNFANPAYVHNDVTSSSVLLDSKLNVLMQVQLLPRSMYTPSE